MRIMKKDNKTLMLGLLVLGVLLFSKKPAPTKPTDESPAVLPEPAKLVDMPNSVSGRWPSRSKNRIA